MERTEIADKRGVRWSILDELPNWMPARDSPVEFMHAGLLGEVRHLFRDILLGSGMFAPQVGYDKPLERFNDFVVSIWWPGSKCYTPTKEGQRPAYCGNSDSSRPIVVVRGLTESRPMA